MKAAMRALFAIVMGSVCMAGAAMAEGQDWQVTTIELSPGTGEVRHFHRNAEFVYVLEGAGLLEVGGKPAVALNPGAVTTLQPKQDHVLKNASRTRPLKVLVVLRLSNGDGKRQRGEEQNHSTYTGLGF